MPRIVSTVSAVPSGISSAPARSSAALNDPRRKLPEIPISLVTTVLRH
jgi:hypothetical protein